MSNLINMTAVFESLDQRKADALKTISSYSEADRAEASRVALIYDRCPVDSIKHLCDVAERLSSHYQTV